MSDLDYYCTLPYCLLVSSSSSYFSVHVQNVIAQCKWKQSLLSASASYHCSVQVQAIIAQCKCKQSQLSEVQEVQLSAIALEAVSDQCKCKQSLHPHLKLPCFSAVCSVICVVVQLNQLGSISFYFGNLLTIFRWKIPENCWQWSSTSEGFLLCSVFRLK